MLAAIVSKKGRRSGLYAFLAQQSTTTAIALYGVPQVNRLMRYLPTVASFKKHRHNRYLLSQVIPPVTVVVPEVEGLLLADGIFLLTSVGLLQTPPPIFTPSLTVPINVIISQSPVAGSIVSFSTPITLLVSSGPPVLNPVWVKATSQGYYDGIYREIGDVFQLDSIADLSDYNVDQDPNTPDSPIRGWMLQLPGNPMPIVGVQSLYRPGNTSPRRTVL